jgi:hypothetical protein
MLTGKLAIAYITCTQETPRNELELKQHYNHSFFPFDEDEE